ncbi:2Fe-2S iron-sulfur cluster binding domain-containing protein [Sulfitobacter sp. S0837]|uniref:2Fe-2S iron-sulfur cluster-binding protein n=1 Tax=Sulfitobacter maritimus TaxID=2741719 RepID=UPI0015828FE6|nr:2Fe-2S iron-sulfur cluster-binding protein [Sulfitobacter maritimus]NUH63944.1 2Fe-2S iron-sulfur cluster binding domain-containing protein [Sulfitobacter maritimus]
MAQFRAFRVADKVAESDIITSFYLEPCDGRALWEVKPGQYLTLRVPGPDGPVLKTYSVSSAPSEMRHYRITVKREAGANGAPGGLGSCWLHDRVEVGDKLDIAAPRGSFVLDETSQRPVLLLSGGVGLTPMVAMLHRLAETDREVHFIHACENGRVHALREEVLAQVSDKIQARFIYRNPTDADRRANLFDAEGVIDKTFLRNHVPIGDYEAYVCGPTPFMAAIYQLLRELGVAEDRIAYEFFGKATSLKTSKADTAPQIAASGATAAIRSLANITNPDAWASEETVEADSAPVASGNAQVEFRASGTTVAWDAAQGSLLQLAENAGLEPAFTCRAGICNACKCQLISGEVEYVEEPLEMPQAGEVLICCSRPKGVVVLDL